MSNNSIPSVSDLTSQLQYIPVTALSNWLRSKGKPYSLGLTPFKKLNQWITQGRILTSDINDAMLDIEEAGDKKVYLRIIEGTLPQTKHEFDRLLTASGVAHVAKSRRSVKNGSNPILNYIVWIETENPQIVIKFSEMQENINFDPETEEFETVLKPVFVVVRIEVTSGFTELRFDTPAKRHIHKDGEGKSNTSVFESYYFDRVATLLRGVESYQLFGLDDVVDHIVVSGKDFFRIHREQTTTTGNVKQIYSSHDDIRDSPARNGAVSADGLNWIFDDLTGYWKASASNGALIKDLYMRLIKSESIMKFERDCLGVELDYAIKKIRDIKSKV